MKQKKEIEWDVIKFKWDPNLIPVQDNLRIRISLRYETSHAYFTMAHIWVERSLQLSKDKRVWVRKEVKWSEYFSCAKSQLKHMGADAKWL